MLANPTTTSDAGELKGALATVHRVAPVPRRRSRLHWATEVLREEGGNAGSVDVDLTARSESMLEALRLMALSVTQILVEDDGHSAANVGHPCSPIGRQPHLQAGLDRPVRHHRLAVPGTSNSARKNSSSWVYLT